MAPYYPKPSFLAAVEPDGGLNIKKPLWKDRIALLLTKTPIPLLAKEELLPPADSNYAEWKCLKWLKSGRVVARQDFRNGVT